MTTKDGSCFARIVIKDVTGELQGVIWNYNANLVSGEFYSIKITTQVYRDNLEFQAQSSDIHRVPVPLNKFDYVKGISESVLSSYAQEIEDSFIEMDDEVYRNVLGSAIHKLDLIQALKQSPYGIIGSMAYKGGLLVHVAHSLRLAKVAITQAIELELPFNPSLVITGCMLRNIGWHTTTLFKGDHLRPRDAYHMTGIHRASARYIDHLMLTCESDLQINIPESKKQALENMCNKRPDIRTLEGKIVSCADNMADVLDFAVASLQKKQIGNWIDDLFTGHLEEN
jgi:hypothetical protein